MKPQAPSPAALRLCHAIGLATELRVGRWVSIDTALALLPAKDRAAEAAILASAVAADLVALSGPVEVAHSVRLTAAGLDACRAAARISRRAKRP